MADLKLKEVDTLPATLAERSAIIYDGQTWIGNSDNEPRPSKGYREFVATISGEAPSSLDTIIKNEIGITPDVNWSGIANNGITIVFLDSGISENNTHTTVTIGNFAEDASKATVSYLTDGVRIKTLAGNTPSEFFELSFRILFYE